MDHRSRKSFNFQFFGTSVCRVLLLFLLFQKVQAQVETVDEYSFGALHFKILKTTSDCAQHPTTSITAPPGTVILGGGAYVNWQGPCAPPDAPGNMLTAMYPNDDGTTWTVASKDHLVPSPASIVAYCIVAQMSDGSPIPAEDYTIVSQTSGVAAHPSQQVNLPFNFVVVGGGAMANYGSGVGSMLYASYPTDDLSGWIGSAKDHEVSDPTTITVWAIGLRKSFLDGFGMRVTSLSETSSPAVNHPSITYSISEFYLTSVGAIDNWTRFGNLLTAVYPQDRQTVVAEGKDHLVADPSTITAYGIGFLA